MRSRDDKGRIELRHLRYFVAVAEARSVTKAAARIGIAQPPLSQQIRQLEDYMQVTLFRRTPHGVDLTPAAENFLAQAKSILGQMDVLVDAAREIERGEKGEFHLGTVYSGLFLLVPAIMKAFEKRFPRASIGLQEMSVSEQVRALHEGRLDVGLVRLPLEDAELDAMVLLKEPLVAAISLNHPLASQNVISLEALAGESMMLYDAGKAVSFKQQAKEIFRKNQLPMELYNAPEINILLGLVDAGLGMALVPTSTRNMKYTNVLFKEISGGVPDFVIGAAWNPRMHSPMRAAFIREVLHEVAEKFLDLSPAAPA